MRGRNLGGLKSVDGNFPACSRKSIDDSLLIRIQFSLDGFQQCDPDGASSILLGREVFPGDPFLADHSIKNFAGSASGLAQGRLADKFAIGTGEILEHAEFD